jgi:hypothetical protein
MKYRNRSLSFDWYIDCTSCAKESALAVVCMPHVSNRHRRMKTRCSWVMMHTRRLIVNRDNTPLSAVKGLYALQIHGSQVSVLTRFRAR